MSGNPGHVQDDFSLDDPSYNPVMLLDGVETHLASVKLLRLSSVHIPWGSYVYHGLIQLHIPELQY
jgi:hypothetical protein